jgi:hypothetical protein
MPYNGFLSKMTINKPNGFAVTPSTAGTMRLAAHEKRNPLSPAKKRFFPNFEKKGAFDLVCCRKQIP